MTDTPPADPYRELREAADLPTVDHDTLRSMAERVPYILSTVVIQLLDERRALLAERDRLEAALARWEVVHD